MFIKRFSLGLGLCGMLLASTALAINTPGELKGFVASKATPAFQSYLANSDTAFDFFADNPGKLTYVLNNPSIQEALVSGKMNLSALDADDRAMDDLSTLTGDVGMRKDVSKIADRNLQAAATDKEIDTTKEVASALDEKNPPVRTIKNPDARSGGTDREGPVITPVVPVRQPVDMNAIPQDVLAKDARGWPKYLNVPANCPAPEGGVKYIHEFAFGEPRSAGFGSSVVTGNSTKHTAVSPWFNRLGNWFYVNMTDKETFAVPFYAGDGAQPGFPAYDGSAVGGSLRFDWIDGSGIGAVGAPQMEVSECPGKFPELGPDAHLMGYGGFAKSFMHGDDYQKALSKAEAHIKPIVTAMRAEPGKRYFLNVRYGKQGCTEFAYAIAQGHNLPKRDGLPVCANVMSTNGTNFYSARGRAPYAGPCLETGPYPANYSSNTCQENLAKYTADNKFTSIRIICKDALGKAPDQKYEASKVGGAMRWTQGANKPGYDSYICVGDWTQEGLGEIPAWEDLPTYQLCSRDNEGGKRVLKAIYKRAETPTVAAEISQTCVFDEKETTGLYRWKETSSTGNPDFGRMYQAYNDYTLQSYWYDKDGALLGQHSIH